MSAGISWSLLASEHPPVFYCWYLWLIDLHYFLTLSESRGPFLLVWPPCILPEVTISSDDSMCSSSLLLTHPIVFAVRSPCFWIEVPLFDLLDFNTGSFHTENSWSISVCVCVCVCVCAQLYPVLCNPIDWSPPGSSVHGIFRGRILEQIAISFSKGSSWCRDQICVSCVSCIGRRILYLYTTWEGLLKHGRDK